MKKMTKILMHAALPLVLLGSTQCTKSVPEDDGGEASKTDKKPAVSENTTPDTKDSAAAAALDYPKQYCENARRLQLRTNIDPMLDYICKGKVPTKEFTDLRAKALAAKPGEIELITLKTNHDEDNQKSEFTIAWAFHVKVRPFEVKSRPIWEYIAKGYDSEAITLKSTYERQPDASLDPGGLHLWSVNLSHDLVIKGSSNLLLTSKRNTQYNLYQVLSGNEEMGLGIEHLTDQGNPSFDASTMVNFSFNDGGGFNDGKGGTVVVTMLHFIIANSGFPKTATDSIGEIAKNIADGMYNGLKE